MYFGKRITLRMMAAYMLKLWWTKTFGNAVDKNDGWSERDIAAFTWATMMQGQTADNDSFDKDFLIDQIWYELASDEECETRALLENTIPR